MYLYGLAAYFLFILFCAFTVRVDGIAVKMLLAFFAWLVATRPLLLDAYLSESMLFIVPLALNIAIMCFGASLDENGRKRIFLIISAVVCVFCFLICIGVLYAAITRRNIILPLYIEIIMKEEGGLHYMDLRATHRNTSSQWYCICFCLAAVLGALSKKKLVKVLCSIMMAAFYVAVSIGLSRISMIALAIAMGMMVALILIKHFKNKKTSVHVAFGLAAVLVVTPVIYKSYNLVGSAVEKLSLAVTPIGQLAEETEMRDDENANLDDSDVIPVVEIEEGDSMYTETRSKENTMMLGGRVLVWKSIASVVRYEPWRVNFGGLNKDYMAAINRTISNTDPSAVVVNTHNYLIETLMLTGVPGLILMALFSLFLVVRMIKVFFSPDAALLPKLLTIPLTATLFKGLGEATLIFHDRVGNDITNYIFFLAAGIFLAYSYELFPEKRRRAKREEK